MQVDHANYIFDTRPQSSVYFIQWLSSWLHVNAGSRRCYWQYVSNGICCPHEISTQNLNNGIFDGTFLSKILTADAWWSSREIRYGWFCMLNLIKALFWSYREVNDIMKYWKVHSRHSPVPKSKYMWRKCSRYLIYIMHTFIYDK